MSKKSEIILEALKLPYCSTLKGFGIIEPVGNSVVHAASWFPIDKAVAQCMPEVDIRDIKLGLNFVHIEGPMPANEDLHIHISHIVGIVTNGTGTNIYERDGEICKELAEAGDMIIIPKGAPHCFEGNPTVDYAVLEFGPIIDYQKHHYTNSLATLETKSF